MGARPASKPAPAARVNPMDALMAEIGGIGNVGAKGLGLKKAKKGTATERKKIDSRKRNSSKSGGFGAKKKTVFPPTEGFEGNGLYKVAYLVGERSSKETRVVELEEPRRDAVLIMECENVDISVVGVAKNISISGCKNYRITVDGSIVQLEVSNSDSGYLTVNGRIYQLTCDKCNSLEVTLCEEAFGADIIHSQCSSLNIGLDNPDKEAEIEFLTLALPSQYKSKLEFEGTKVNVTTEPVNHNFG